MSNNPISFTCINFRNPQLVRGLSQQKGDIVCGSDDGQGLAALHTANDNAVLTCDSESTLGIKYKDLISGPGIQITHGNSDITIDTTPSGSESGATAAVVWAIQDEKSSAQPGGIFLKDQWITRSLNTFRITSGSDCTLSNNEFTLKPGKYIIHASAPAFGVQGHQIRLYDVSSGSTVVYGTSEYGDGSVQTRSFLTALVNVTLLPKKFRIEHRCAQDSSGLTGLGVPLGFGNQEVYTIVDITRNVEPESGGLLGIL